ncbi:MAG: thiosulfate oxidation carrier protein SoxY [Betaproteobacteria bacterium]|jgi:sulfur-oxidizing protein SoxY
MDRREFLARGGGAGVVTGLVAAGWLPAGALAGEVPWLREAFEARSLEDVMRVLGAAGSGEDGGIAIVAPEIAENGAVVPLEIAVNLPDAGALAIIVERNPSPLAALFEFPAGTASQVSTRVKMAQTSNVIAVARIAGQYRYAAKEIKITLGGCGG